MERHEFTTTITRTTVIVEKVTRVSQAPDQRVADYLAEEWLESQSAGEIEGLEEVSRQVTVAIDSPATRQAAAPVPTPVTRPTNNGGGRTSSSDYGKDSAVGTVARAVWDWRQAKAAGTAVGTLAEAIAIARAAIGH